MGVAELPALKSERWTAISSQNRWAGLVMAGGDPLARIVPTLFSPTGRQVYNGLNGVLKGSAMLVRSMLPPGDKSQAALRVWFGKPLARSEDRGWIFVEGTAYVAVRPSSGGWHWDPAEPSWMIPDQPSSAIILQGASREDFPDIGAFKAAVAAQHLTVDSRSVTFAALGNVGDANLKMRLPEAADAPTSADLEPPFVFRSPFINSDRNSNRVVISNGKRRLVLDFGS